MKRVFLTAILAGFTALSSVAYSHDGGEYGTDVVGALNKFPNYTTDEVFKFVNPKEKCLTETGYAKAVKTVYDWTDMEEIWNLIVHTDKVDADADVGLEIFRKLTFLYVCTSNFLHEQHEMNY